LYNPEGIYKYANGFNPVALIAWAIGTGISLYNKNISFIVGLPVGMIVYYFLMKSWGIPKYQPSLLNKDET
jgi:NCS1 family nucleobase:cation symporter-1